MKLLENLKFAEENLSKFIHASKLENLPEVHIKGDAHKFVEILEKFPQNIIFIKYRTVLERFNEIFEDINFRLQYEGKYLNAISRLREILSQTVNTDFESKEKDCLNSLKELETKMSSLIVDEKEIINEFQLFIVHDGVVLISELFALNWVDFKNILQPLAKENLE
ncbi:hypothetical protein KTH46_07605 [Acinetobacter bereziniae]|uniref:hypothetical protein n=1 Tax=Acinetobacter bereziniae TaxID=106648 RepID=UPI0021CF7BDC|nr:hypothetical protein [Acinetobacter bereziniae]MCU4314889.1 hypothetical protein [Acinetobacter bereziniae]